MKGSFDMKKKLTNDKKYEAVCRNCFFGRFSPDGQIILCDKKGMSDPDGSCKKYKYDPLKRVPRKAPKPEEADPAEFEL